MANELLIRQNVEEDFMQFKKDVNPNLLFESLEALIILLHKDKEGTDDFLDYLAQVYRYILSKKDRELISVNEESTVLQGLVKLFNYLPYRSVTVNNTLVSDFLLVPTSLLFIMEQIIRSTISSLDNHLNIELIEEEETVLLKYCPRDKINDKFTLEKLSEIQDVYSIYSPEGLSVTEENSYRMIRLPKLKIEPNL